MRVFAALILVTAVYVAGILSHMLLTYTPSVTKAADLYMQAIAAIHMQESECGRNAACWQRGPCGELGEYQITPIFRTDIFRLTGTWINVLDNAECVWAIDFWLRHYGPLVGADTVEKLCKLYKYGPTGYRKYVLNKVG